MQIKNNTQNMGFTTVSQEEFDEILGIQELYLSKISPKLKEMIQLISQMESLSGPLNVRKPATGDVKEWIVVSANNKNGSEPLIARRLLSMLNDKDEGREIVESTIGFPIQENIVKNVKKIIKNCKGLSYDALSAKNTYEIKTIISSESPSSFSPGTVSNTICADFSDKCVRVFPPVKADSIRKVKVNNTETFSDQQKDGRRPRIKIPDLLEQTGGNFNEPQYTFNIEEIF